MTTSIQVAKNLRSVLEERVGEIVKILPPECRSEETAARFIACACQAISETPKFDNAEMIPSLAMAVKKAAGLGLEIGAAKQHAFLIPYGKAARLQIGYKGYMHLAYRSGKVKVFRAGVVRRGDAFEYDEGSNAYLKHTRDIERLDGDPVAYYAFITTKDNGVLVEVMSVAQVEKIRDGSDGYQMAKKYDKSSPWDTNFDEMAKKTVVRRISKVAEFCWELGLAVTADEGDDYAPRRSVKVERMARGTMLPDEAELLGDGGDPDAGMPE